MNRLITLLLLPIAAVAAFAHTSFSFPDETLSRRAQHCSGKAAHREEAERF